MESLKTLENNDRKRMTILVVGGHPADVFDHCGGTLAHHVMAGDRVVCLALTQGLRIHDIVISEKYRNGVPAEEMEEFERIRKEREEAKYQEVRDACACLGITEVRFLSYDEKILLENEPMIDAVAKIIREVRPDIVMTHYPGEQGGISSHHATAAKITLHAVELAGTADFEENVPGWRPAQIYFMTASYMNQVSNVLGAMANPYFPTYVEITDVIDKKYRALSCMKSQQYDGAYAVKRTECDEGCFGRAVKTAYAEAFVPLEPEVYDLLPISKRRLAWENEPELNTRIRSSEMKIARMPE